MASYLAPAYLRIGGTLADSLYFSEHNTETLPDRELESCFYDKLCSKNITNITMTGNIF